MRGIISPSAPTKLLASGKDPYYGSKPDPAPPGNWVEAANDNNCLLSEGRDGFGHVAPDATDEPWIELPSYTRMVPGSSPGVPTIELKHLEGFFAESFQNEIGL